VHAAFKPKQAWVPIASLIDPNVCPKTSTTHQVGWSMHDRSLGWMAESMVQGESTMQWYADVVVSVTPLLPRNPLPHADETVPSILCDSDDFAWLVGIIHG
jgi:hypothetical protein